MIFFERHRNSNVVMLFEYSFIKITLFKRYITQNMELKFARIKSFVEKNKKIESAYKDLTPVIEFENNKTYIESLDWALSNNNILNIGLSGPYGSGKSSILKTFKESSPHYQYLSISLATFHTHDSQSSDQGEGNTANDKNTLEKLRESEIEKRILQQLFYKVKSKKIPFGRFRKIGHLKTTSLLKGIFIVLMSGSLATFLFATEFSLGIWNTIKKKNIY